MEAKKIALLIGASRESIHAIDIAQQKGYYVIAFDGNADAEGLKYADEYHVVDINHVENIVSCISQKPALVLPVPIGRALTAIGKMNDYYKLKGLSEVAAENCTDKYKFHCILENNKLRDCQCTLIPEGTSFLGEFEKCFESPRIIKPRYGSGSRGVQVIEDYKELEEYFAGEVPTKEDYVLESILEGEEYGVDGAVFDGKLTVFLVRKKQLTELPYRQCIGYFSVPSDRESHLYNVVEKKLCAIAEVMEMNNCLFHCDLMWNGESVEVIEISGRPSGHYLHNVFTPLAIGNDVISLYIDYVQENKKLNDTYLQRQIYIGYFDFENVKIGHIPDEAEVKAALENALLAYQCEKEKVNADRIIDGHSLMDRGYFILEGKDEQDLLEKSKIVKSMFQ